LFETSNCFSVTNNTKCISVAVGQASNRRLNQKGERYVLFCFVLFAYSFCMFLFHFIPFACWIYSFICYVCSISFQSLYFVLFVYSFCVFLFYFNLRFFCFTSLFVILFLFHFNRFVLFCSLCLFVMFVSLSFHSFCLFLSTVCNFLLFLTFKFCFVLSFIFEHQSRSCSRILMRQKMKIKERRFDSRIIKDNNCWKDFVWFGQAIIVKHF
jgi:hypothetical protein